MKIQSLLILLMGLSACVQKPSHYSALSEKSQSVGQMLIVVEPAMDQKVGARFWSTGFCTPGTQVEFYGSALRAPTTAVCSELGVFSVKLIAGPDSANAPLEVSLVKSIGLAGPRRLLRLGVDSTPPQLSVTSPTVGASVTGAHTLAGTCESPFPVRASGAALQNEIYIPCVADQFQIVAPFKSMQSTLDVEFSQGDTSGNTSIKKVAVSVNAVSTQTGLSLISPAPGQTLNTNIRAKGACVSGLSVRLSVAIAGLDRSIMCAAGQYDEDLSTAIAIDGIFSLIVSQTINGQLVSQSATFTRDTAAPSLTVVSPVAGGNYMNSLTVQGSCETGLPLYVGASFLPQTATITCANSVFSTNLSLASVTGSHRVMVSQTDQAANSASLTVDFKVTAASQSGDSVQGAVLYAQYCASCHMALAVSTKKSRTVSDIQIGIQYVVSMKSLSSLTQTQLEAIAAALAPAPAMNPEPGAAMSSPYACNSNGVGAFSQRKLTNREYLNTLEDLMSGMISRQSMQEYTSGLPEDRARHQFDTQSSVLVRAHVDGFFNLAEFIGGELRKNPSTLGVIGDTCAAVAGFSDVCARTFVEKFGLRAFRRPLKVEEIDKYQSLFLNLKTEVGGPVALTLVVEALLQSPSFMYKLENEGTLNSSNQLQLTSYEVASRLSYLVIGSMPDVELFAAAKANALTTTAQVRTQLDRLMQTPRARMNIKEFYDQWFGLNRMHGLSRLPAGISGVTVQEMNKFSQDEVHDFMADLVWNQKQGLKEILTSDSALISHPSQAKLYGLTTGTSSGSGPSVSEVFEAENFTTKGQGELLDGGWNLWNGGTSISRSINIVNSGSHSIEVRARRHTAGSAPAQAVTMTVKLNGMVLAIHNVLPTTYANYNVNVPLTAGTSALEIIFSSGDFYQASPFQDINLLIDRVTLTSTAGAAFTPSRVSLAANGRAGLLTRAGMLVSGGSESDPIVRGVRILRDVQCLDLHAPNPNDPGFADSITPVPFDAKKTIRERVTDKTKAQQCLTCHSQINPIGFAFETYDAFGAVKTKDVNLDMASGITYELPVDTRVSLLIDGVNQPVNDARQMSQLLATSTGYYTCATQKLFAFTYGRKPASEDSCTLEKIYKAATQSGGSFKDYFRSIAEDPNFLIRTAN